MLGWTILSRFDRMGYGAARDAPAFRPEGARVSRGAREDRLVVQRGVALLLFESEAILEETLRELPLDGLACQRLGPRALVSPASSAGAIERALHERGVYPRVVRPRAQEDA